jgi:hypothetical protein
MNAFENYTETTTEMFFKYQEKYKEYKNRAKRGGIMFTITFEQFYLAVTSGCYICDLDGKTNIIGVDRLNPKKGYTYLNIGGCCWNCNRMKSNMAPKEFMEYLNRVKQNDMGTLK